MISLKKFLSTDNAARADRDAQQALWRALNLLIEGIGKFAGAGDESSRERFRHSIGRISQALLEEITADDLIVQCGAVLQALDENHRDSERWLAEHDAEFQHMVKMLTAAVAAVSSTGDTNVTRLAEIEQQVASASKLDDVRVIKGKLAHCLEAIRSETDRQRQNTAETVERLEKELLQANEANSLVFAEPDPITGLPPRPAAEAALSKAGQANGYAFAAILVLDNLQGINSRFGRSIGDDVLKVFADAVSKKLPAADRLYRWGGPALLTLIRHAGNIEQARGAIARIADAKLEHRIEMPSRNVLIPLSARWAVFPMMPEPRLLFQRIDTFASVVTRE